ncbi:MAG: thioredoxin [Myxococcaceae bacterium]|nr:thioredoxin [Myxococcaceae bacterium]
MGIFQKVFGITPKKPPVSINEANFEREVLASELPVLLDVWGPSCGPCKQLEPIIFDLASHYSGRVKVCELSAQLAPNIAARLQVQATPTVLYFHNGAELERIHGFRSSLFHKQTIEELFAIEP